MIKTDSAPKDLINDDLFPLNHCVDAFNELNSRVLLYKTLYAVNIISGDSPSDTDPPSRFLLLPTPSDERYQKCFLQALFWVSCSFRVPQHQVEIAKTQMPHLHSGVFDQLENLRFQPKITCPDEAEKAALGLSEAGFSDQFIWKIEDEPEVIEVVQTPLRVLQQIVNQTHRSARQSSDLVANSMASGQGKLDVFHRPYSDSQLIALVEAAHFFFHGLKFGPIRGTSDWQPELGYRATNIIGRPPLDKKIYDMHFEFARKSWENF